MLMLFVGKSSALFYTLNGKSRYYSRHLAEILECRDGSIAAYSPEPAYILAV